MKYLYLIFIFFLSSICSAEIIKLQKDLPIDLPDGYSYLKKSLKATYKKHHKNLKFTKKEINEDWQSFKSQGFDLSEDQYEIISIEGKNFWEREKTEDGRDKNSLLNQKIAMKNCYKKKGKSLVKCMEYHLRVHNNDDISYTVWLSNNKSKKLQLLSSLTDDQIAQLTNKEIKLIRKLNASDIKYKTKKKMVKAKGYRKIRIMPDSTFYIEQRSIITFPKESASESGSNLWKETVITSFIIPYKERTLVIQSYCIKQSCDNIEKKMSQIINPIFKIDPNSESFDFASKIERENLIKNVRNGYRIYKAAKVLMFLL